MFSNNTLSLCCNNATGCCICSYPDKVKIELSRFKYFCFAKIINRLRFLQKKNANNAKKNTATT